MLTALYDWLRLGGAEGLAAYYSGFAGWLLGMGLLVGAVHFGWALVTTLCAYSALRFLTDCASAAGHAAAAVPRISGGRAGSAAHYRPPRPAPALALRLAGDTAELGLTPRRLMAAWFVLAAATALAFALVKALRPGIQAPAPPRRAAARVLAGVQLRERKLPQRARERGRIPLRPPRERGRSLPPAPRPRRHRPPERPPPSRPPKAAPTGTGPTSSMRLCPLTMRVFALGGGITLAAR